MFIMHLALGGCLRAPPVEYGLTADTGGHIAYILGAAAAQAEADAQVSIVTRAVEADFLPAIYRQEVEQFGRDIKIIRLQTANRRYMPKEQLEGELLNLTFAFVSYLYTLPCRPDVIHAHFADAAEIAFVARDAFGIPVVYTPHALGRPTSASPAGGSMLPSRVRRERRALEEADAVIVSSSDEATCQVGQHISEAFRPNLHRLPPGVPEHCLRRSLTTADHARIDAHLAEPRKPIVLAIARPVRKKNLSGLMRAFAGCAELRREANLVILAGRSQGTFHGEQASVVAELRDLVEQNQLDGEVAMPTDHTDADVTSLYQRAARGGVFVNAALHEPFGLTLLEAATHGAPVVSTRAGGARDIVQDLRHGILVDPEDEAAIAKACLAIVSDRDLHAAFSANGRRNVGRYDWRRYAELSLQLFAALISRRTNVDPLSQPGGELPSVDARTASRSDLAPPSNLLAAEAASANPRA